MSLSARSLSFAYRGRDVPVLADLTYDFAAGSVTAVTGPSGSGKSTLLYVLGLMLRPRHGSVLIGGKPVSSLSDGARSAVRARVIGFVFQDAALDASRPLIDAVLEPSVYIGARRGPSRIRALSLLDSVGLAECAFRRPGQVSGGQAQRAAIARALANDPEVVLADEPTGNLDRGSAAGVIELLRRAAGEGRTVVVATHDPFVVGHADDVLAL